MMKIALVCPTVGQTRRGYERFITDLWRLLKDDVEVMLLKGGGTSGPQEKALPHVRRTGLLHRLFPDRHRRSRSRLEFTSFALALFPHLAFGGYDVVHFIDPPLVRLLSAARRVARGRFRLLFTHAGACPYDASRWVDHVHCLAPVGVSEALESGVPPDRLTLAPVGVFPEAFRTSRSRHELRRHYNVPQDAFVILSVTSLNRQHKRVDYLIEEVARLDGDPLLWLDGSLQPDGDVTLLELASQRLGNRYRLTHAPSDRLGELFRLADVMVSTSLHESYGMSVVEAMCAGLPVLTHDSEHFRWLVGDEGHRVDMRTSGNLSARLAHLMRHPSELCGPVDAKAACRRFRWAGLKTAYLDMYRKVMVPGPQIGAGPEHPGENATVIARPVQLIEGKTKP